MVVFYGLRGKVIHVDKNFVALDCGGVVYRVFVSFVTKNELSDKKTEDFLYTYTNIRENSVEIFGFKTKNEYFCFKLLLSVSGVGSRICMGILSAVDSNSVISAIASGNSQIFRDVSGVGPKLALRIVLELKDKVKKLSFNSLMDQSKGTFQCETLNSSSATEAVNALFSLGYSREHAMSVVTSLDSSLSTEDLIRLSLKSIARKKF